MKKFVFCLMVACLSFTLLPVQSNASTVTEPTGTTDPKTAESPEVKVLLLRIDEINKMDKSEMDAAEKKELRKEVKALRNDLKTIAPGLYISGAAAILLVILLIILL